MPRGSETVLLVEDEDDVRELIREVLEAHGYTVLEARDGVDAVRLGAEYAGTIHLLLTDVVMPQMSGRDVVERLTAARPALRVLFISGYIDHGVVDRELPGPLLLKPFTTEGLLGKIRETLQP